MGERRRERIEKGSRERIEIERKEKHRHLPLLVVQLPQGTEFPTRFCSNAAVNFEVLVSSSRLGKGSGLKKL